MRHLTTRMIYSHWDSVRGERAAPERGEIEPGAIRHALADTFILELLPSSRTEVRLAGTRLCALFGGELKGRAFETLWAEAARPEIARCIEAVVEETTGVVAGAVGRADEGGRLDLEMVLLPLRHRGKTHARILGALSPARVPAWIGLRAVAELDLTAARVIAGDAPGLARPGFGEPSAARLPAALVAGRPHLVVHEGGRV